MVDKRAYSVQMNLSIPESEKQEAARAVSGFNELVDMLQEAQEYLDKIYDPFKKCQNVDMELITKYRKTFRQYRDVVEKKYQLISKKSERVAGVMSGFSTDTATTELMSAFLSSVKELIKYIDIFKSIFSNFNNTDFRDNLLATIDSIKKQTSQIKILITDRVLDHINSNILAKNWASDIVSEEGIEDRVPLVVQLYRERQKALSQK